MSTGKIRYLPLALVAILAFAVVGFLPAASAVGDIQPIGTPSDVGRISQVQDNAFILGKDDVDWSYAELNLVVEEGDVLQTDETGRAAIEFPGKVVFRIGENSRIAILENSENKVFGMDRGRAYVRIGAELPGQEQFVLTFPSGEIIASKPVLARIDVAEDGSAQVKVIRGMLDVQPAAEGAWRITGQERVVISPEGQMQAAEYQVAQADDFDQWNEESDIALSSYRRPEYVQEDIVGLEDLNGYGNWVYVDKYNCYAWRPDVVEGWRPYYYGHWYDSARYGWIWVPEEPWGYATYHYGSWNYDPHFGWIWVPGYVWRPAYVHWIEYDSYVGWVPLDYYGYPVITTYPYHIVSAVSGYPIDFFSFTFVYVDYFRHFDYHYYYHHGKYDRDDRDHHGDREHRIDWDRFQKDYEKLDKHYRSGEQYRGREVNEVPFGKGDRKIAQPRDNARVKFVKDIDINREIGRENIRQSRHKGRVIQDRPNYKEFLDVQKNPTIAKKIERIENRPTMKPGATVPLPKKLTTDQVRKLDYRPSLRERQQQAGVHRTTNEIRQWQRVPENTPVQKPAVPEKKRTEPQNNIERRTTPEPREIRNAPVERRREIQERMNEQNGGSKGRSDGSQDERLQRLRQLTGQATAPDREKISAQRGESSREKVERQAVLEPQKRQSGQPARPNQEVERNNQGSGEQAGRFSNQQSQARPMEQRTQEAVSARERLMNQRESQQAARNDSAADRYAPPSVRATEQSRSRQKISVPERSAAERGVALPQQIRQQNEARTFQRPEAEARPEARKQSQPERNVIRSQPQERSVSIDRQDSRRDDSRWSGRSSDGGHSSQPTRSDSGGRGRR